MFRLQLNHLKLQKVNVNRLEEDVSILGDNLKFLHLGFCKLRSLTVKAANLVLLSLPETSLPIKDFVSLLEASPLIQQLDLSSSFVRNYQDNV
jgi:hypothetical protein